VIHLTLQIQLLTGSGHENFPIFAPGGRDKAVYRFSSLVASRRDRCNCWRSPTCSLCRGTGCSWALVNAILLLPFFMLPILFTYKDARGIRTPTIPFLKSIVGVLAVDLLWWQAYQGSL